MYNQLDYSTFDRINLQDMCNEIVRFVNEHKDIKNLSVYSSREGILREILPKTNDWESEITKIGKLCSGNISIKKLRMSHLISNKKIFDKELWKSVLFSSEIYVL